LFTEFCFTWLSNLKAAEHTKPFLCLYGPGWPHQSHPTATPLAMQKRHTGKVAMKPLILEKGFSSKTKHKKGNGCRTLNLTHKYYYLNFS
jgi:hypothetical protein